MRPRFREAWRRLRMTLGKAVPLMLWPSDACSSYAARHLDSRVVRPNV